MGKKQHQSDKLYLTTTEWKHLYGGHKDNTEAKLARAKFRRLPFTHCSLSLQPFENPICTLDGTVFDLLHVVPFIKKHGLNPVTGEKIDAKTLVHLKYHKNAEGHYHCPITFKVFTPTSHIVAIRTSGNVFSYQAVEELNIKAKFWKDLIDDTPFVKKDIIQLQDPSDLDKFNIEKFHYIKCNLKTKDDEDEAGSSSSSTLRKVNMEAKETLAQLARDYKPPVKESKKEKLADTINAAHYSTGKMAAGFTSTTMDAVTQQKSAIVDDQTLIYRRVKKKGYVRLATNYGPLNLELYCEQCPKACENFIKLCKKGYYNGSKFHRLIRNFMLQGGDPTGTGVGGESIWGKPFQDEIEQSLSHSGRGVLSMANKGPNTNGSQFFITFRSCKHLDKKHTIFGKVVGGLDTMNVIEKLQVDKDDKPLKDVVFEGAQIFVDPFEEAEQQLAKEREELASASAKDKGKTMSGVQAISKDKGKESNPKIYKAGVGKYLPPSSRKLDEKRKLLENSTDTVESITVSKAKKSKLVTKDKLNDFSAW